MNKSAETAIKVFGEANEESLLQLVTCRSYFHPVNVYKVRLLASL